MPNTDAAHSDQPSPDVVIEPTTSVIRHLAAGHRPCLGCRCDECSDRYPHGYWYGIPTIYANEYGRQSITADEAAVLDIHLPSWADRTTSSAARRH